MKIQKNSKVGNLIQMSVITLKFNDVISLKILDYL